MDVSINIQLEGTEVCGGSVAKWFAIYVDGCNCELQLFYKES